MSLQTELLVSLDKKVSEIVDRHEKITNKRLWMPTELIFGREINTSIPPEITAMLVLNLLTEDGLPYFTSLLTEHLGESSALRDWTRRWTAEEDRHGTAIKRYLHVSLQPEQVIAVERLQFQYLRAGFNPDWGRDPLKLIAYVVLQEYATQVSHHRIAERAKNHCKVLAQMLWQIGAEERQHHQVYLAFFKHLLQCEPDACLVAFLSVLKSFAMPGEEISEFAEFSRLQATAGVFGPRQFARIVSAVCDTLGLATLTDLNASGREAQEKIMKLVKVIERAAQRPLHQGPFSFSFLQEPFSLNEQK